jgi:L-fuculose-phosphate aldolase
MTELEIRKAICEIGRLMHMKNLVAATDGNISVRLGADRYLCTPSAVSKALMQPNDMIVCDGHGKKISGEGKVTSEFRTHIACYEERPDISAVVHAHPPKAIGFTLADASMAECVLPEVVCTIGGIPTTEYATPATAEGSEVIRELIRQCDAVMLDRHGAVTVGPNVYDAYFKMEKIEHAAESILTAHLLGKVRRLDPKEVQKLATVRGQYGTGSGKAYSCACEGTSGGAPAPRAAEQDTRLDRVVAETLKVLGYGSD